MRFKPRPKPRQGKYPVCFDIGLTGKSKSRVAGTGEYGWASSLLWNDLGDGSGVTLPGDLDGDGVGAGDTIFGSGITSDTTINDPAVMSVLEVFSFMTMR